MIGEGETEGGGSRVDCSGAPGAGAGALGVFLLTTSTQEPGMQAAGQEVLGLVLEGTGEGLGTTAGAADATTVVCAGGERTGPEGPAVGGEAGTLPVGPSRALFWRLLCRRALTGESSVGGEGACVDSPKANTSLVSSNSSMHFGKR